MQPKEIPEAADQWRELETSLEGGAEFAPFWYFGTTKRTQPPDKDFYVLNPKTVLRYEPDIFEYASLFCGQSRSKKFFNEDGYKILKTIQHRSLTIKEIVRELGMNSHETSETIETFLEPLVEESLVLKGKYTIYPHPLPELELSTSPEFSAPYPRAPFYTMIYLTYNCNVKCKHCGLSKDLTMQNLSGSQWVKIFDLLERAGITVVTINGGEPLSHPDSNVILQRLADSPFWVRFFTNGTLLTDEKIEYISRGRNFYLSISLDGSTAQTHDDFRGKKGTFKKVLESFERLNKASSDIMRLAACVIHKNNLDQFEDLLELAVQYNLWGVQFISMNYVGNAQTEGYYVSVQEHPEILENVKELAKKFQDKLFITVQGRGPTLKDIDRPFPKYFGNTFVCNAGVIDWMIDPVGNVFPCEVIVTMKKEMRDKFYLGNITTDTFSDLWNNPKYNVFRGGYKESDLSVCTKCSFYEKCGQKKCRLYSLVTTGDFHGPAYECHFAQEELGIPVQRG